MSAAPFIERDCVFTFEGRDYESGGAYVTDTHAAGYPEFRRISPIDGQYFRNIDMVGDCGELRDWHGNAIGTCRIVARWPTPRSWVSSYMYQIEATIGGVTYTGRGAGSGMLWRGKRKARPSCWS
jgi:hypothetical protein